MRRQVTREIVQPTGNATVSFPLPAPSPALPSVPFLFHPKYYTLSPFLHVQQRMWCRLAEKRGRGECVPGDLVSARSVALRNMKSGNKLRNSFGPQPFRAAPNVNFKL